MPRTFEEVVKEMEETHNSTDEQGSFLQRFGYTENDLHNATEELSNSVDALPGEATTRSQVFLELLKLPIKTDLKLLTLFFIDF